MPAALDDATFACHLAIVVLGYPVALLSPTAIWLLNKLVPVATPQPGDLVGYARSTGVPGRRYRDARRVMLYLGGGQVIGAWDASSDVAVRLLEDENYASEGAWRLIAPPSFRTLETRGGT